MGVMGISNIGFRPMLNRAATVGSELPRPRKAGWISRRGGRRARPRDDDRARHGGRPWPAAALPGAGLARAAAARMRQDRRSIPGGIRGGTG